MWELPCYERIVIPFLIVSLGCQGSLVVILISYLCFIKLGIQEGDICMAKVFLVDLENVGWNSLLGINLYGLSGRDRIFIFFSNNTGNCPPTILDSIVKTKAKVETIQVESGTKDALDFQLSCFLGAISRNSKNDFFILSKDNGYSPLISFSKPVKVSLIGTFSEAFEENVEVTLRLIDKKKSKKKENMAEFQQIEISGLGKKEIQVIKDDITKQLKSNKNLVYSDYNSMACNIVSYLVKCKTIDVFEANVHKISNKSSYQKEIINICRKYIA